MDDVHHITCPCCNTILVVERRSGKIVDERRPILDQSSGDRYEDALKKVRERGSVAEEKYQKFTSERGEKMAKLDALFKERVKEAEDSGEEVKKFNPLEMD